MVGVSPRSWAPAREGVCSGVCGRQGAAPRTGSRARPPRGLRNSGMGGAFLSYLSFLVLSFLPNFLPPSLFFITFGSLLPNCGLFSKVLKQTKPRLHGYLHTVHERRCSVLSPPSSNDNALLRKRGRREMDRKSEGEGALLPGWESLSHIL